MTRARGLEERVLLNVASGFVAGFNASVSRGRIDNAVNRLVLKSWLERNPLRITNAGRAAVNLELREAPLPNHLADLLRPDRKTDG